LNETQAIMFDFQHCSYAYSYVANQSLIGELS